MSRLPDDRRRVLVGVAMVLAGAVAVQLAAAVASSLFAQLSAAGTSTLRFGLAAVVIIAVVRPRLVGRTRGLWLGVVVYGVSLAILNLAFLRRLIDWRWGLS